jgi:DNA-binding FadR family transcriptional regulator
MDDSTDQSGETPPKNKRLGSSENGSTATRRGRTKADQVAADVERSIISQEFALHEVIGSEGTLAERYSVSRPIVREAFRILEMSGIATVRRGPGGGLTVNEPNADPVVAAAQRFLSYRRVPPSQLHRARLALELASVEEIINNLDEKKIVSLKSYIVDEPDHGSVSGSEGEHFGERFHVLLAELGGNTVLELFVPVLARLSSRVSQVPDTEIGIRSKEIHFAHNAIAEAICQGELGLAQHRMRRHLAAMADSYVDDSQYR